MSKKIEGTAGRSDGNSHGSDADAEPPFLKEAAAATALALAQYQFRRPSDKIPPEYLEKRDGEIQKKNETARNVSVASSVLIFHSCIVFIRN